MKKHNKVNAIVLAYASCAANIADNIAPDCSSPLIAGFTGRGVLINNTDAPVFTYSGSNPRIITAVTLASGVKVAVVDNTGWPQPFNGSSIQSTDEDGMIKYDKTLVLNIPARGAAAAKNIVEPLHKSALGFTAILEMRDRNGDGSFVVVGSKQGLKATPDGVVRNEYENGGCVVATMSCREAEEEVVFFDTDYTTTKTAFEALIAKAY